MGASIDTFVNAVIRARLARPDVADLLAPTDDDQVREAGDEVQRLRSRLASIEADYDTGLIDGRRFAVATEKVSAELGAAETARARLSGTGALSGILAAPDPAATYEAAPLGIQRAVLGTLVTVALLPAPRGHKFDPATVVIEWARS